MLAALALLAHLSSDGIADAPEPKPPERFERDDVQRMHVHENFDLLPYLLPHLSGCLARGAGASAVPVRRTR